MTEREAYVRSLAAAIAEGYESLKGPNRDGGGPSGSSGSSGLPPFRVSHDNVRATLKLTHTASELVTVDNGYLSPWKFAESPFETEVKQVLREAHGMTVLSQVRVRSANPDTYIKNCFKPAATQMTAELEFRTPAMEALPAVLPQNVPESVGYITWLGSITSDEAQFDEMVSISNGLDRMFDEQAAAANRVRTAGPQCGVQ